MCYQWVGRGRKVTCDNPDARSPAAAFNECDGIAERCHGIVPWDVSMLVAIIVDLTARIYSFDAPLPMARRLLVVGTHSSNKIQCRASGFVQSNPSSFALGGWASDPFNRIAKYKCSLRCLTTRSICSSVMFASGLSQMGKLGSA
jgi:hypothetical protein